jgi:hypothetical protein
MSANNTIAMSGSQDSRQALQRRDELRETKVYGTCVAISTVWAVAGAVYFVSNPANFLRMWPHEFGSFLSGWAAPMAALWVFATVLLQREQLKAQAIQLEQKDDELGRSLDQLKRNGLTAELTQLSKRMVHAALRLSRTAEPTSVYLAKQGERITLVHFLGCPRTYVALFKANEIPRALDLLGNGLLSLIREIRNDWVLHVSVHDLEELCTELKSLGNIVAAI